MKTIITILLAIAMLMAVLIVFVPSPSEVGNSTDTRFTFGQHVRVESGFYRGAEGVISEVSVPGPLSPLEATYRVEGVTKVQFSRDFHGEWRLSDALWFRESSLVDAPIEPAERATVFYTEGPVCPLDCCSPHGCPPPSVRLVAPLPPTKITEVDGMLRQEVGEPEDDGDE